MRGQGLHQPLQSHKSGQPANRSPCSHGHRPGYLLLTWLSVCPSIFHALQQPSAQTPTNTRPLDGMFVLFISVNSYANEQPYLGKLRWLGGGGCTGVLPLVSANPGAAEKPLVAVSKVASVSKMWPGMSPAIPLSVYLVSQTLNKSCVAQKRQGRL